MHSVIVTKESSCNCKTKCRLCEDGTLCCVRRDMAKARCRRRAVERLGFHCMFLGFHCMFCALLCFMWCYFLAGTRSDRLHYWHLLVYLCSFCLDLKVSVKPLLHVLGCPLGQPPGTLAAEWALASLIAASVLPSPPCRNNYAWGSAEAKKAMQLQTGCHSVCAHGEHSCSACERRTATVVSSL